MTQNFYYDPNLPFFEVRRAIQSRECYVPHTHETLSIGAVDRGFSELIIEDKKPIYLEAGDLVIIPENCVHSCNPQAKSAWSYQMLYVDVAWFRTLQSETKRAPFKTCQSAHHRTLSLYQDFSRLNAFLFENHLPEAKEEALISFLGALLLKPALEAKTPPQWVFSLQEKLSSPAEENCSLSALSEAYQLGKYHLIRTFRAHTGMSPHAYLLDCRIKRAKARLKKGAGLSDLAHELGFSDQSHFQKAFKKRVCTSPGDYQNQVF